MKKIFEKYNHQNSLILISLYPKKGEIYSAGTSGVASYVKNVARNMNRKVVLLADYEKKPEVYEEHNVLVYRCFKNNSPYMWVSLLRTLFSFLEIKSILLQLDFAVYGHPLTTSLAIPFLGLIKIFGYKVSVTMHHVVLNVFKLKGHVGLGDGIKDKIKGYLYNGIFHAFYFFLGLVTSQIIVLEDVLKEKLSKLIPDKKIVTISHGVDTQLKPIAKKYARKKLNINQRDYVIVFFGFVNWFKGADCFVDAFKNVKQMLGNNTKIIIAGGESPTLKDREYYQIYYSEVVKMAKSSGRIEITGYVPQNMISTYFSAADLIVLPYRSLMTASGVLSLVFSYKKAFIISNEISDMFRSADFQYAMDKSGLKISDLVFRLEGKSALIKSENVLKNGIKKQMISMAEIMSELRSYKNMAKKYEQVLSPSFSFAQQQLSLNKER